jgi:putative thioredoxin
MPQQSPEHSIEVSAANFEAEVIEASHQRPVLVDFWAPWCGPCRTLRPVLDKLAAEYDGAFRLATLNTEEQPELAARFDVRGIPNVKAFVDGRVLREFTGALPEAGVRQFLSLVVPSRAEVLRREARALISDGEFDAAEARLQEALGLEPELYLARLDLAELLIARQDFPDADRELETVPPHRRDTRHEFLATRVITWKRTHELPDLAEIAARLEREPDNPTIRMALAERLISEMHFEGALEELLKVVRATRGERRDEARKAMLRVFTLAADQTEMIARYRRLLAAELN